MATIDGEDFDSDTSDEDYVPEGETLGSEEEESGEEELLAEEADTTTSTTKRTKKKKKPKKKSEVVGGRKRQGGIKLDDDADVTEPAEDEDLYNEELAQKVVEEEKEKKEQVEKKKTDDLWASFIADVGAPKQKSKPAVMPSGLGSLTSLVKSSSSSVTGSNKAAVSTPPTKPAEAKSDKLTITKEFDFAGETVKITKEVDINSREAKRELRKQEETKETASSSSRLPVSGIKRPGGGLGSVLGMISKKPKMGTLEKSKLDWDAFKQKEGIQEELQTHNKGKDGYIERQAFLNRTDVRQFEIERDIRLGVSGKR